MKRNVGHVERLHRVRNDIVNARALVVQTPARRALGFLDATVESTERLAVLSDSAFPDAQQPSLLPVEDFDPTVADFARSMILFAGAGIDATIKQLVRDCLKEALKSSEEAKIEFRKHVERCVEQDLKGWLVKAITTESSRDTAIEEYLQSVAKGSMQSVEQIYRITKALGLTTVRSQIQPMAQLFKERNVVAHELDLLDPEVHGTLRRRRTVEDAWKLADEAYVVTLEIVSASASLFRVAMHA